MKRTKSSKKERESKTGIDDANYYPGPPSEIKPRLVGLFLLCVLLGSIALFAWFAGPVWSARVFVALVGGISGAWIRAWLTKDDVLYSGVTAGSDFGHRYAVAVGILAAILTVLAEAESGSGALIIGMLIGYVLHLLVNEIAGIVQGPSHA